MAHVLMSTLRPLSWPTRGERGDLSVDPKPRRRHQYYMLPYRPPIGKSQQARLRYRFSNRTHGEPDARVPSLACQGQRLRLIGERRHDVAGKTADVLARAAEIDDDVFDPTLAQGIELAHDLVRRAEERALGALVPSLFFVRFEARPGLVIRAPRQRVDPHMPLISPLERGLLVGRVLGDMDSARNGDMHRVEGASAPFDVLAELGDLLENLLGQRMLAQQHIIPAVGHLTNRARAARPHPERRMRLLRGPGVDDGVVELPILTAVGEGRLGGEGLGDDFERLFEPRIRLLHRQAEPGKFVVAVTFADAEIEPPTGEKI